MAFAGGEDVIVGLRLLQNPPHALDIVAGVAPIALGVEVAEKNPVLLAAFDRGDRPGDLSGHEGFAAQRPS